MFVSLGSKKELRSLEVIQSPNHRTSIAATSSQSMDATIGTECEGAGGASIHGPMIQHQLSLDQSSSTCRAATLPLTPVTLPSTSDASDATVEIVAESLDKILDYKVVREKRIEMDKKLDSMRKKHDKEKLRAASAKSGDLTDGIRKTKFYMNNKLVKRLSNKNMYVVFSITFAWGFCFDCFPFYFLFFCWLPGNIMLFVYSIF